LPKASTPIASDPELVDVTSVNDFYRLRAGISAQAAAPVGLPEAYR
jgi:hypothetical protein